METGRDSGSEKLRTQGLARGEKPAPVRPMGHLPTKRPAQNTAQDFNASSSATAQSSNRNDDQSPSRTRQRAGSEATADRHNQLQSSGLGGLYFLLATTALMCGVWFVGPRLVEEYHYAAEMGKFRGKLQGEYENAVVQLEERPLHNVSRAYQLLSLIHI